MNSHPPPELFTVYLEVLYQQFVICFGVVVVAFLFVENEENVVSV